LTVFFEETMKNLTALLLLVFGSFQGARSWASISLVNTKSSSIEKTSRSISQSSLFASASDTAPAGKISLENLADKRVLVVGGSGRVGGSVVCQLTKHNAKVTVGGTRSETFEESRNRWKQIFSKQSDEFDAIPFATVDREDHNSIANILQQGKAIDQDFDLVVHTAGPFQGKVKTPNGVIQACVENGVGYIDVCDDYCTASAAKSKYTETAKANGVPCIISTGCWVSTYSCTYTEPHHFYLYKVC